MFRIFTNDKRILRDLHSVGIEAGFAKDMAEVIETLVEDLKEPEEDSPSDADITVERDKHGRIFYCLPDGTIRCTCPEGECALNEAQPPSLRDSRLGSITLCQESMLVAEEALVWWLKECHWSSVHGQVSYIYNRLMEARGPDGSSKIRGVDKLDCTLLSQVLYDYGTYANVHATLKQLALVGSERLEA